LFKIHLKRKKHDKYETKSNPPLEISTSLQIKLDRNNTLILEKKSKNNNVYTRVMLRMHRNGIVGVTLLPFLPEN
jgi:hypothetical protein